MVASVKKRGRPTRYTPAIADAICKRLAEGETLRAICRSEGMPDHSTVVIWAANDAHGFYNHYARSRDIGLDVMADELLEIADDGKNDWMESNDPGNPGYRINGEHQQRSRLRVDTRKWYLSKLAPKRYGDKLGLDVTVNESLADRLARARAREGE
jgi:hypothetical protein